MAWLAGLASLAGLLNWEPSSAELLPGLSNALGEGSPKPPRVATRRYAVIKVATYGVAVGECPHDPPWGMLPLCIIELWDMYIYIYILKPWNYWNYICICTGVVGPLGSHWPAL